LTRTKLTETRVFEFPVGPPALRRGCNCRRSFALHDRT